MKPPPPLHLKRLLRSPRLIVGELAALAGAGACGALLPELHIFLNPWFGALTLLIAVSLAIVVGDQLRVLLRSGATTRRVGAAMLHAGLLLAIMAGALRALFATEAVVDLVEGETLPATAAAWSGQFPGLLARPFQLQQPLTLQAVHGRRYPDGSLQKLSAQLSAGELAVNRDLSLAGGRLFLASDFGAAALVEWRPGKREAALLDSHSREATSIGPHALRAHLRALRDRPESVEVRVMRGAGLLYSGVLHPGETIGFAGGEALTLHALPLWARLRGSRDNSFWPVCAGFALILAGSILLFVKFPLARAPSAMMPTLQPAGSLPFLLMAIVCVSSGCSSREKAAQLVTRYNEVVSEAYRRGDVRLIDPVVGPNEGKKLAGLIGVRLDFGLTLDSQMLALEVIDIDRAKNEMRVRTRERWRYCDRRIGSGERSGEESTDSYEMLYVFKKSGKAWLVDEIQFAAPPKVGRQTTTWVADRAALRDVAGRSRP